MIRTNLLLLFSFALLLSLPSCVSKRKYVDALGQNILLAEQERQIEAQLKNSQQQLRQIVKENNLLENRIDELEQTLVAQQGENIELRSQIDNVSSTAKHEQARLDKSLQEKTKVLEKQDKLLNAVQTQMALQNDALRDVQFKLYSTLGNVTDDEVWVEMQDGNLHVTFRNDFLYAGSSASRVSKKGSTALESLASSLQAQPHLLVAVEVHTNGSYGAYKNHWQYSAIRAANISSLLQEKYDILPSRIIAIGKADHSPIDFTDTPDGKKRNARTEFVIKPPLSKIFSLLREGDAKQ